VRDRPVDGEVSPQHHLHFAIANATHDEQHHKGPRFLATKIRNGWFESARIKRKFHARLRQNLERMGVETRGWGMSWRIKGVERETELKFSPRRKQAQKNLERGVPKDYVGLVGRESKKTFTDEQLRELKARWEGMLTSDEKNRLNNIGVRPASGRTARDKKRSLDFARRLIRRAYEPGRTAERAKEREAYDGPSR
jgi:hypothetical protein